MTQENSIIPAGVELPIQKYDDSEFNAANTAIGYLPRLQLMGSSTTLCKEGKFPVGNWALVRGQEFQNISPTITAAVLAWRPKALDMRDAKKIVSCFDVKNPKFAEIKKVNEDAPQGTLSGCMVGPEFLLWLPDHKTFCNYMMANSSAQQEAPNLRQLIGKLSTLNVVFIPSKKFGGWHGPKVQPCSTPMAEPINAENLRKEMDKFLNPPAIAEEVPEAEAQAAGANRAR